MNSYADLPLNGAIGFPVTPFDDQLDIDHAALHDVTDFLIEEARVSAVVPCGAAGELFCLAPAEAAETVQTVVRATGSRVPVIAGVGFGIRVGADLARAAEQAGVDAILLCPPYAPPVDAFGLAAYVERVAANTSLPVLFYARPEAPVDAALANRLAAITNLVGIKDGQGDVRRFIQLRAAVGDEIMLIAGAGDDLAASLLLAGAPAYTSSIASFFPEIVHLLLGAVAERDVRAAAEITDRFIEPIFELRRRRGGYEISLTKAALNHIGLRGGRPRPPVPELRPGELDELDALLESLKRELLVRRT